MQLEKQLKEAEETLTAVEEKGRSTALNAEELNFELKKERGEQKQTQKLLDDLLQQQAQQQTGTIWSKSLCQSPRVCPECCVPAARKEEEILVNNLQLALHLVQGVFPHFLICSK